MKMMSAVAALGVTAGLALAGVGDVASFVDNPRLFNDFPSSNLVYSSDFAAGTVSIHEDSYGSGGWANKHAAWLGDSGGSKVDFNYDDQFDTQVEMTIGINGVANIEAGFNADQFGFGFFGVKTENGEVMACCAGGLPFYSFGTGLYNVGDTIMLRMIHTPGTGDGVNPIGMNTPSTMEYMYNNMTTGSGWVSSGAFDFDNVEGGIHSPSTLFYGVGAQIMTPGANDIIDINFSGFTMAVPAPASVALIGLGGLVAARRRR